MRLIYTKDGFTKNEKEEWRVIIFNNILDGLRMTIAAMEEFGVEFENEKTTVRLHFSFILKFKARAELTSRFRSTYLLSTRRRICAHTRRFLLNILWLSKKCGWMLGSKRLWKREMSSRFTIIWDSTYARSLYRITLIFASVFSSISTACSTKNLSPPIKMSYVLDSVQLELPRRILILDLYNTVCLMLVDKDLKERNGYTASKMLMLCSSWLLYLGTTNALPRTKME